jgi:hypothetical protein
MDLLKRLSELVQTARIGLASQDVRGAQRLLWAALRKRGPAVHFNPTPASIKVYRAVIASKVALIDRLPSKYRQDAIDIVWSMVMKGYDEAALGKELHDRFGLSLERAARIAHSQCNMARSVIDNASLIEIGVKEAMWQYQGSCMLKGHEALAGRRYVLAGGLLVGDKRVWPGSEPMCSCTINRIETLANEDS